MFYPIHEGSGGGGSTNIEGGKHYYILNILKIYIYLDYGGAGGGFIFI